MERRRRVTLLVDTHYVLWAAIRSDKIAPWAKTLIGDPNNTVLVSVASVYEIGIKVRSKKMPEALEFERNLIGNIGRLGYVLVELSAAVMLRAARFESNHTDPFDRIIAAQVIQLDVDLLSTDGKMDGFGVRRLRGPGV